MGRETVTGQQPVAEPTPETAPPAPDYSEAWQTQDDDSEYVLAQLEFSPAPVPVCTLHERHPELIHIKRCGVVGCPDE